MSLHSLTEVNLLIHKNNLLTEFYTIEIDTILLTLYV